MDGFEHISADAGSGQSDCGSASEASPNGNATDDAFLTRAERWRQQALAHPDDRQACIGAVNAGLAKIVHAHQMAIDRGIENCTASRPDERSIQSAITAQSGLLRQWHSLMSFQARLEQMRLDAEKLAVETQLDPLRRTAR